MTVEEILSLRTDEFLVDSVPRGALVAAWRGNTPPDEDYIRGLWENSSASGVLGRTPITCAKQQLSSGIVVIQTVPESGELIRFSAPNAPGTILLTLRFGTHRLAAWTFRPLVGTAPRPSATGMNCDLRFLFQTKDQCIHKWLEAHASQLALTGFDDNITAGVLSQMGCDTRNAEALAKLLPYVGIGALDVNGNVYAVGAGTVKGQPVGYFVAKPFDRTPSGETLSWFHLASTGKRLLKIKEGPFRHLPEAAWARFILDETFVPVSERGKVHFSVEVVRTWDRPDDRVSWPQGEYKPMFTPVPVGAIAQRIGPYLGKGRRDDGRDLYDWGGLQVAADAGSSMAREWALTNRLIRSLPKGTSVFEEARRVSNLATKTFSVEPTGE